MSQLTWKGPGKYQPLKKVAENYARMMNDGQILTNRQAIDIIDARVMALVERIDLEHAPDRIKNLYALWEEFSRARKRQDSAKEIEVIYLMDAEFEAVYHDYAAWEQMIEVLDLRRKMVDSEVKIIKEMKAFISVEMAYQLVAKLLAVITRVVKDPKQLRHITYEFQRIIGEDKLRRDVAVSEVVNVGEEEEDAEG